jgi:hypothetical protein
LTFLLTRPATLRFVLEVLIVEKDLLACGEDEIRPAVGAFEGSVLEF